MNAAGAGAIRRPAIRHCIRVLTKGQAPGGESPGPGPWRRGPSYHGAQNNVNSRVKNHMPHGMSQNIP